MADVNKDIRHDWFHLLVAILIGVATILINIAVYRGFDYQEATFDLVTVGVIGIILLLIKVEKDGK